MSRKNHIGILGTASISRQMIDSICKSKNGTVIGIWGRTKKIAEEIATEKEIPKVYQTLNEVFADEEIDTVYIATPNSRHFDHAMGAIAHKKNVIVEKTAFMTTDQAIQVFAAAEKQDVFVFEAIRSIYEPNFKVLAKAVKRLGKIHGGTLKYQNYSKQYLTFLNDGRAPLFDENHGGGTLRTIGIYPIYMALQLFGNPINSYYFKQSTETDLGGTLIFDYEDFKITMLISKINLTNDSISEVYGEKGTVQFHSLYNIRTIRLRNLKDNDEEIISVPISNSSLIYEFDTFSEWILTKNEAAYRKQKVNTLKAISIIEQALNGGI